MTLGAPWALVGLVLLPVLWWLHRRASRPPVVDVPSLLFLEPEARPEGAPVLRRLDADLVLALAAAAFLVLAATAPTVRLGPPGRTVRVVLVGGATGAAPRLAARASEALAAIAGSLARADRLEVERVPSAPTGPRPDDAALLSAARAGPAALRIVISDRLPRDGAPDVSWVAVGDPAARNLGIVAVDVAPTEGGVRVFANATNDGAEPVDGTIRLEADGRDPVTRTVSLPAHGYRSATFDVPSAPALPDRLLVAIERPPGSRDDVPADDRVALDRRPLPVRYDPSLPSDVRRVVERGLEVVLGERGTRPGDGPGALFVTSRGDVRTGPALVLSPLPPDAVPLRAAEGPDVVASDPLAKDLSAAAADLLYAPGAERVEDEASVILARRVGERRLPVVVRRGGVVRFAPDPTKGSPPPVDTPLWPLFLENLVREVSGGPTEAGYRVAGLLDPASSEVGRDVRAFDARVLPSVPFDRPAAERPLAPWLVGAALACLALLWLHPFLQRRRLRPTRAAAAP